MYYKGPGVCEYCYATHYIDNGKCKLRTSADVTNCLSYSNNSGTCSLCIEGYHFNGANCDNSAYAAGSGLSSSECAFLHFSNQYCI